MNQMTTPFIKASYYGKVNETKTVYACPADPAPDRRVNLKVSYEKPQGRNVIAAFIRCRDDYLFKMTNTSLCKSLSIAEGVWMSYAMAVIPTTWDELQAFHWPKDNFFKR